MVLQSSQNFRVNLQGIIKRRNRHSDIPAEVYNIRC